MLVTGRQEGAAALWQCEIWPGITESILTGESFEILTSRAASQD